MPSKDSRSSRSIRIQRINADGLDFAEDQVAVEEPLEVRVVFDRNRESKSRLTRQSRSVAVTMRTPGQDEALATGFLISEGVIESAHQIDSFTFSDPTSAGAQTGNRLEVHLAAGVQLDLPQLQRNFYVTSSCGVCGKASLEAVRALGLKSITREYQIPRPLIHELPNRLRCHQPVFQITGGNHGAGLFRDDGELLVAHEDIGRHNAVDKVIGAHQLSQANEIRSNKTVDHPERSDLARQQAFMPADILVVSGRASFELVQKAIAGRIGMLVAVGAPSSLAVDLAREFQVTLVGFTSNKRFNVYSNEHRIGQAN